jgi:hypothetical protein
MNDTTTTINEEQLDRMNELTGRLFDARHVFDLLEQHLISQDAVGRGTDDVALGVLRTVAGQVQSIAVELEDLHQIMRSVDTAKKARKPRGLSGENDCVLMPTKD